MKPAEAHWYRNSDSADQGVGAVSSVADSIITYFMPQSWRGLPGYIIVPDA